MGDGMDRDEEVELGKEIRVRRRTGSAIIAVRVSTDLLRRIQEFAQGRGLTVSDVMRMGAEQITGQSLTTAYTHTVRTLMGMRATSNHDEYTVVVDAAPVGVAP